MSQCSAWSNWKDRARKRVGTMVVILSVMVVGAGCDSLLDVELPGSLPAENLRHPDNAALLINSVQSMFECWYPNFVGASATWSDEARTGSQRSSRQFWQTRQMDAVSGFGNFDCQAVVDGEDWPATYPHYEAYGLARDIGDWFEEWTEDEVPNRQEGVAVARAFQAYAVMVFGQTYCMGAVLVEGGPIVSPRELHDEAERLWQQVLQAAQASGRNDLRNLALVGLARTHLWYPDYEAAAEYAAQVPAGFRFDATYDSHPNRENWLYVDFIRENHHTVAPQLTGMPLEVDGVPDPRVAVYDRERANIDGLTPAWGPEKYPSATTPIRMASWEEAQLMLAEANRGQDAVDRINVLRQQHGLPEYVPNNVSDDDEILDQVLEERRKELWLEGQRLNDMLRYFDRPSIRDAWPQGITHDGDPIRQRYCWYFPSREVNANPSINEADIPLASEGGMHPDWMRR